MIIDRNGFIYFRNKEEEETVVLLAKDIAEEFLKKAIIPVSPEDLKSFNLGVIFGIYSKDIVFDDDAEFLDGTNNLFINKGLKAYKKWRSLLC